jgi:hypothetical protein
VETPRSRKNKIGNIQAGAPNEIGRFRLILSLTLFEIDGY